jgi:hypothetical protein
LQFFDAVWLLFFFDFVRGDRLGAAIMAIMRIASTGILALALSVSDGAWITHYS